ncbi:MAG TPA: interleukin-like EMT inducer domain-containing protein, partial [Ignavibacteriaceae bacterium]|nr:interleukin-like EMT inducer domain-containing protein [Ignavibacteriaceae bacterium]
YCNFLFGDPIVGFKTPIKPNFSISESSFEIFGTNPSDQSDSAYSIIRINNFGRVAGDSLDIFISDAWQSLKYEFSKKIPVPLFADSLIVAVPVKGKVGEHKLTVELDKQQLFDEIYETDNAAEFRYTVYSTSVRPIEFEKYYTSLKRLIRLLNPTLFFPGMPQEVLVSVSSAPDFSNFRNFTARFDTLFTDIQIDSLIPSVRYWWRAKLNNPQAEWSEVYSFRNLENNLGWFADYSYDKGLNLQNTVFDSSNNAWKLNSSINTLVIHSAASDDGEYASILYNGTETLPNTFFWGITAAEIDTLTLMPGNFKYFVYNENSTSDDSLISYLNSLPQGKIIVMTLCADAAQSVLGFSKGTDVRRAIEGFGSLYADSIGYRDSWCIIGKKGAAAGSVPEAYSKRGSGEANLSITKQVNYKSGFIVFPKIINSAEWNSLTKKDTIPSGSRIDYFPVGIKSDGQIDTLPDLSFSGNTASLLHINPAVYPELRIGVRLNSNELFESPSIFSVGADFRGVPELGINYQIVSVDNDTVEQGGDANLRFYVYNAGGSEADSFDVAVEVIKQDNSREIIFEQKIISLNPDQNKFFNVSYNTLSGGGENSFYISIDNSNHIKELYKDNNYYSAPFYVLSD